MICHGLILDKVEKCTPELILTREGFLNLRHIRQLAINRADRRDLDMCTRAKFRRVLENTLHRSHREMENC